MKSLVGLFVYADPHLCSPSRLPAQSVANDFTLERIRRVSPLTTVCATVALDGAKKKKKECTRFLWWAHLGSRSIKAIVNYLIVFGLFPSNCVSGWIDADRVSCFATELSFQCGETSSARIHFHISWHRGAFIDKAPCYFTEGCRICITSAFSESTELLQSAFSNKCELIKRFFFLFAGTKRPLRVLRPSWWTSEYSAAALWHAPCGGLFVPLLIKPSRFEALGNEGPDIAFQAATLLPAHLNNQVKAPRWERLRFWVSLTFK